MALWDTANGALRSRLFGHLSGVESVAFSEDGERVASASWDTPCTSLRSVNPEHGWGSG